MKFGHIFLSISVKPNFDIIKFVIISFYVLGILTSIKKENDEKSEEGTDITMSFPSGHDSDGLHYRVQGTFTRWAIILIHTFHVTFYKGRYHWFIYRLNNLSIRIVPIICFLIFHTTLDNLVKTFDHVYFLFGCERTRVHVAIGILNPFDTN